MQPDKQIQLSRMNDDNREQCERTLRTLPADMLLMLHRKLYRREYPGTSRSELIQKIMRRLYNYSDLYEKLNPTL